MDGHHSSITIPRSPLSDIARTPHSMTLNTTTTRKKSLSSSRLLSPTLDYDRYHGKQESVGNDDVASVQDIRPRG